jgi:predicted Zn-dependent protease
LKVSVAYIYGRAGRRSEALKLLQALKARAEQERISPMSFARICVGLGDYEQAFAWLQKLSDEQSDHLLHIAADPIMDPLRSDSRFQELLRRIGLTR